MLRLVDAYLRAAGFVVETFASGQALLERAPGDAPGCLIIDVMMPEMSGFEVFSALRLAGCPLPAVFISGSCDIRTATSVMKAGAIDFLCKPIVANELIFAVRDALDRDRRRRAVVHERAEMEARLATLTPRERDVLDLVVVGKANKVIAADLGLSQRTVEIHRARVMEKMDAASLAQLVRMVLDLERSAG